MSDDTGTVFIAPNGGFTTYNVPLALAPPNNTVISLLTCHIIEFGPKYPGSLFTTLNNINIFKY